MHMINTAPCRIYQQGDAHSSPPIACYITDATRDHSLPPDTNENELPAQYETVPRSEAAITTDLKIYHVRNWLKTLERPIGLTDTEYKMFMHYCTEFFLTGDDDRLWRKDSKGTHKIVIPQER